MVVRKRGPEIRRERTPPRISRDQYGSSLTRDDKPLRHISPRHDASHRRHTPVREKRRDYVCKVYPYCMVDTDRDYLSINKRYPKLSISPEFSKMVVHWPKENLKLSLHTPVSFEHDLVEMDSGDDLKGPSTELSPKDTGKQKSGITLWNAKVILMSGISMDALEELSSEKSSDDRIPHFSNILRFAILRKDHSFMAIGGSCDVVDCLDSSIDESSLIQNAVRYARNLTQVDLQNCQNWNRFLEIHYDRVGKDGLFSHKEITVLFVPDLSECLPTSDSWREQWHAYKKAIVEREHQLCLKREKSSENKEGLKGDQTHSKMDKDIDSSKNDNKEGNSTHDEKLEKKDSAPKKDSTSTLVIDVKKKEKDEGNELMRNVADNEDFIEDKKVKEQDLEEIGGKREHVEEKEKEIVVAQDAKKPGKKRIVKKVVKQKVAEKKAGAEIVVNKENEKLDVVDAVGKDVKPETVVQQDSTSTDPAGVKTFTRKKVVKKVPVAKTVQIENKDKDSDVVLSEVKTEKEAENEVDKSEGNTDSASAMQEASAKSTVKRKIIKRVPKKKETAVENKSENADTKNNGDKVEKKIVQEVSENENKKGEATDSEQQVAKPEKKSPQKESKTVAPEKQDDDSKSSKRENKSEKDSKKQEKGSDDKRDSGTNVESEAGKPKVSSKDIHDGKREKTKDEKDESRRKSSKEVKEKGMSKEPPRDPGLFLQTKWNKESKLRSISLSLDSLLDYSDKDIEESTFEISLFAESLYEMLQFQMGCRLLKFLQKLRQRFVYKRNQRKRQRDENPENEEKKSTRKRSKTDEPPVETESVKNELAANSNYEGTKANEENPSSDAVKRSEEDATKKDNETDDDDDDPEEDPDEDQEMQDAIPEDDTSKKVNEDLTADAKSEAEKEGAEEKENSKQDKTEKKTTEAEQKPESDKSEVKETVNGTNLVVEAAVDKELLQAFRFFDRNRVGYVRVEDLRMVLHSLGKFLSHREVKDLVQSALLESNTGRDNRILYNKLVRMSDI